jgi:cytochrome subunit of sulfide dehydrogenase
MDYGYFYQQMQDFKTGRRPSTVMRQIAHGFSDQQVEHLATFFSEQSK